MYRPNAASHVRSAFSKTTASLVAPAVGERVWCVILGEPDLGDTRAAWVDSYVMPKGAPRAFQARVGSRVVWSYLRGREFVMRNEAHAEQVAADYREESHWGRE